MAYEKNSGLGVHNHYGPRKAGGEQGVLKTEGYRNEFVVELPMSGLDYKFPQGNGVYVTGVDLTFAVGTVSAVAIGGVAVAAATDAAPVAIPEGNTGVVTQTGGTGGKIVIQYKNVSGDATH